MSAPLRTASWLGLLACTACPVETLDLTIDTPPIEPCFASFVPSMFAVGAVERDRTITRTIAIENMGTTRCELASIAVQTPDPDLKLLHPALPASIAPAERFMVTVELRLDTPSYENALLARMSSGEQIVLPLSGTSEKAELLIAPVSLDFEVARECGIDARMLSVFNTGSVQASATITTEGADVESFLFSNPTVLVLEPGDFGEVQVVFSPRHDGIHEATLLVGEQTVPLRGFAPLAERVAQDFRVPELPKVDVLLVFETSPAMIDAHPFIEPNLRSWFDGAAAQGLDLRFAATTTDMSAAGAQGRFLPLDGPRVLTATASDDELRSIIPGADGSTQTLGLQAIASALNEPLLSGHNAGFLRDGAWLSVVIIAASDDLSPGPVDSYVGRANPTNSPLITISGAVGDRGGCDGPGGPVAEATRYLEAIDMSAGVVSSICARDWSRAFDNFGITFSEPAVFYLDHPARPESIEVYFDNVFIPASDPAGTVFWSYEPSTSSVRISAFAAPAPGSLVTIIYERSCD